MTSSALSSSPTLLLQLGEQLTLLFTQARPTPLLFMSVSLGFSFSVLQIVSQSHPSQFHLTLYSRHDRSLDLDVLFEGWL